MLQVAAELARVAPIQLLRPNMQPWKGGVLSLDPVVERLRQLLPATFEELPVPLAVGVVDQTGKHTLIRSGPLPEAVAASAAIPMMFAAVDIPGRFSVSLQKMLNAMHPMRWQRCNLSLQLVSTMFSYTSICASPFDIHCMLIDSVKCVVVMASLHMCRCCCWTTH